MVYDLEATRFYFLSLSVLLSLLAFLFFFVILSEVEISKKKQKELKHVAQSGLEIGFGFIFTFLNDKHLKFLSLAKPRLGFSTVSLYTFLIKNYGTIPSK